MKQASIKTNYIYNIMYQILAIAIPLITSPYLTRKLGADGLGLYSYSFTYANYFALFILLGLNNYGNREIAKVREDKKELKSTFSEIYCFQFFMFILVSFAYIIFVRLFTKENFTIYLIQYMYIFSVGIDINWCCFGLEKFKLTVTRNSIIKIITTCMIFILVKNDTDLWKYAIIISGGTIVSQLCIWPFIIKDIGIEIPSFSGVLRHIKPNFVLFLPALAVSLYTMMDKIMLGLMTRNEEVAFYTYAEKIIEIPRTFVIALGTVMLPRASYMVKNGKEEDNNILLVNSMRYVIMFSAGCTVLILLVANKLIPWYYGATFDACARYVILLAPIVVFNAWNNTIRTQYIIPRSLDRIYIITVSCGACVNFVLNLLLIPLLQGAGAAIATVLSEFTVCFVQFLLVRKQLMYKAFSRDAFITVAIGGIVFAIVGSISLLILNDVMYLLFTISNASILYIMLVYCYYSRVKKVFTIRGWYCSRVKGEKNEKE